MKYHSSSETNQFLSKDCLIKISMMAKYTKIFGNDYIFGSVKTFLKNDPVMFITALLLKLSLVIKTHCLAV